MQKIWDSLDEYDKRFVRLFLFHFKTASESPSFSPDELSDVFTTVGRVSSSMRSLLDRIVERNGGDGPTFADVAEFSGEVGDYLLLTAIACCIAVWKFHLPVTERLIQEILGKGTMP